MFIFCPDPMQSSDSQGIYSQLMFCNRYSPRETEEWSKNELNHVLSPFNVTINIKLQT